MAVVLPAGPNRADCAQVLPALAKVDQSYQAAVALFYLEDYAYKDIAEILSVPIGTVKSRIARGILQLREILLSTNTVANPAAAERDLSATSRRELLSAS
jgi:DNA-directed RNA polymerase specialized sigma24 family protein